MNNICYSLVTCNRTFSLSCIRIRSCYLQCKFFANFLFLSILHYLTLFIISSLSRSCELNFCKLCVKRRPCIILLFFYLIRQWCIKYLIRLYTFTSKIISVVNIMIVAWTLLCNLVLFLKRKWSKTTSKYACCILR